MVKIVPSLRFTLAKDKQTQTHSALADAGKLAIRGISGALLIGHGAQKLFGVFDGPGIKRTSQGMDSMRLRPGRLWALTAGASEAGGGALMGAGVLHPLGPIMSLSAMVMAFVKGHWGKPIWAAKGGGELSLTNASIAVEQLLQGPGNYSLDRAFGVKLPRWVGISAALGAAGALSYGLWQSRPPVTPATPVATSTEAATDTKSGQPLTSE